MGDEEKKAILNSYRDIDPTIQRLRMCYNQEKGFSKRVLIKEICLLRIKKQIIEESIENIQNLIYREVLYRNYILGQSLLKISEEMNYSSRHLERFVSPAINDLTFPEDEVTDFILRNQ